jgi:hypothetical protein
LEKIVQAVENALSSSSSSSTDPNQAITSALQQLFGTGSSGSSSSSGDASNTVSGDTTTLLNTTGTGSTGGTTPTSSAGSTSSADGDSTTDPASSSQTLGQLLQSYGVSPQQFRSDLITALSGSGGSLNESLFQNFEPGSGVDAIA